MAKRFSAPNLFKKKSSYAQVLQKKVEIVTSPHLEEPSWDIVLELTDLCNKDEKTAKMVLSHLRRIFEKATSVSLNNQSLKNCLTVMDSMVRNGNRNIIIIVHSNYLPLLSKFLTMADNDEKHKSLLGSEQKTCKDICLELIYLWALTFNSNKLPNFNSIYRTLQADGLPFNKIAKDKLVPIRQKQNSKKKNNSTLTSQSSAAAAAVANQPTNVQSSVASSSEHKTNSIAADMSSSSADLSPWESRHLKFGVWYKRKLKADLKDLADMICMTQDVLAMNNKIDSNALCVELREAQRRLVCIMLRAKDPGACDTLMQWCTIISSLLECSAKLKRGHRFRLPGVTKQSLEMLIDCL